MGHHTALEERWVQAYVGLAKEIVQQERKRRREEQGEVA